MSSNNRFHSIQPTQAFSDVAADYVYGVANEIGVDANVVAITTLAAVNSLLLDAECSISSSFTVGNSLFVLVGAPPSSGKTPCTERAKRLVNSLFDKHLLLSEEEELRRRSAIKVEEARQKTLLKKAAKEHDEIRREKLTREHVASVQALEALQIPVSPLMGQMSLYSCVKELERRCGVGANIDAEGGLFAEANSVAKELLKPLLKAWSSEELSETTKKASCCVKKPVLTVAALWQDKPVLQYLRNPKYYDVGLVARILPYISPKIKFSRLGRMDKSVELRFEELAERILIAAMSAREKGEGLCFFLSVQAADCFSKFQLLADSLITQGQLLHEYPEIAGKIDVQAVKLAMILHALELTVESGNEISEGTMYKACQLALFFAEQHARILGSTSDRRMVDEGRKLIETLISWASGPNWGRGFRVDDLKRPTGFSKGKCEKILFWLQARQAASVSYAPMQQENGVQKMCEFWHADIPTLQALLNS